MIPNAGKIKKTKEYIKELFPETTIIKMGITGILDTAISEESDKNTKERQSNGTRRYAWVYSKTHFILHPGRSIDRHTENRRYAEGLAKHNFHNSSEKYNLKHAKIVE